MPLEMKAGFSKTTEILFFFLGILVSTVFSAELTTSNIRFSHQTHYRQNISCESCHVSPASASEELSGPPAGWVPLRPSKIVTLPDVAERDDLKKIQAEPAFARPSEKLCLTCHLKAKKTGDCGLCHFGKPAANRRDRERVKFGAKFPHEKHGAFDCLDCHPKIGDWESLDGAQQDTSMVFCMTCHNGAKAKKGCKLCHDPTPWPEDHLRNYEKKHGISYRSDPQSCRMCHEDSSCVACHTRKPRDHTLAWVSRRHDIAASTNPDRCNACHSDRDVCRRCHSRWKSK